MIAGGAGVGALAPEALLTREEVAKWLKVNPRQLDRWGVPCIRLSHKTIRYLVRDVLAWLEEHRRPSVDKWAVP